MKKQLIGMLILSMCLIFTLTILNVSAASQVRTATISPSALTGEAGDTIKVEIRLNSSFDLAGFNYKLTFDPAVFSIQAADIGTGKNKRPECVDDAWFSDIRAGNIVLFDYLGTPTFGANATAGSIILSIAALDGPPAEDNEDNVLVGKYTLTIKADAPSGATEFTFASTKTVDTNQSDGKLMIFEPVTFTVLGDEEPDVDHIPVGQTLGAQVRLTPPQGLRFGTKIMKNAFFNGTGADDAVVTEITYGTLILPKEYLGMEELTLDNATINGYTVAHSEGNFLYEDEDDYLVYTAVLTGIPEDKEDTVFTARAYIKYKLDGVEQVTYFDPIDRSVDQVRAAIELE